MSSLFGGHSYSHPTNSLSSSAHPAPDYAAFSLDPDSDDDDHDDDDDDDHHSTANYNHHSASTSTSHPFSSSSSSASPPLASSSRPSSFHSSSPSLPGGYDFEPQSDPSPPLASSSIRPPSFRGTAPAPPSINLSTRPSTQSRLPRAPSFSHDAGAEDLYGRQQQQQGALLAGGLRSFVDRLRGGSQPLPSASRTSTDGGESSGLLFAHHDDSDETDGENNGPSSYPPAPGGGRNIHLPLPARAPAFAAPTEQATRGAAGGPGGRIYGGGMGNDGVFANLSAKPDGAGGMDVIGEGPDKDEVLPTYDDANRDTTPPYWETTVLTPGGPFSADDIVVDGLPVGNFFSFAWNLLVSMSFQFVGFLLTYLLHTTHAAKNGSRAGLGITLIQLGFYLKQRADSDPSFPTGDATGLNGAPGPSISESRWSWWGSDLDASPSPSATTTALGSLPTQLRTALSHALDASDPDAVGKMPSLMGNTGGMGDDGEMMLSEGANEWLAFVMVTVGSFLLIGGCLSYWRAVRWARALRQGQGPGADAENMVAA